jgi:hypothetical protein
MGVVFEIISFSFLLKKKLIRNDPFVTIHSI